MRAAIGVLGLLSLDRGGYRSGDLHRRNLGRCPYTLKKREFARLAMTVQLCCAHVARVG
jgi:hypothetical protein